MRLERGHASDRLLGAGTVVTIVWRAVIVGAIEVAAFAVLATALAGVHVRNWQAGVLAVLVIGLLNAVVRPVILFFAVNLGMLLFAVLALVLNAVIVLFASALVPGFDVDGLIWAFLLAIGLAVLNTLFSNWLGINDDDAFYRNVIERMRRSSVPQSDLSQPGTIIVQIDGLAESILRAELATGHLPTLQRWLTSGSHRLVGWECDVPSMTSSGQAGILWGNNANIPAFRWFEKEHGRLMVSNHPRDARLIDERQAHVGWGLLQTEGSSIGNIFTGEAEHNVMTMSRITDERGAVQASPRDFYAYLVNPYNLYRGLGGMVWDLVLEHWQAVQQWRNAIQPRMHRGGSYPLVRATTNVVMRDATTWLLIADMFSGRRVSYCDYLGYDEIAHHAGPATHDARRALHAVDHSLRQLEVSARHAERHYEFVVLSDHGQSTGWTFRQRYGVTLEQVLWQLMGRDETQTVGTSSGQGEGVGQVEALLTQAVRARGLLSRLLRRTFHRNTQNGVVELNPEHDTRRLVEDAEVVVCASGNLALVYFTKRAGRLTQEQIETDYPGLLDGLVRHPGVGFVVVRSEAAGGPLVLGSEGRRNLTSGEIQGHDPLAPFGQHTAAFLTRQAGFEHVGDLVVNSLLDPGTGQVAAFEELIGCHGGAGGEQTHPFVLFPSHWTTEDPTIVGAEHLHRFLRAHVGVELGAAAT
jgi:uncharacterized membrane protein YvlD (DUF360 family)